MPRNRTSNGDEDSSKVANLAGTEANTKKKSSPKDKWIFSDKKKEKNSKKAVMKTCYTCGKRFRYLELHKRMFHVDSDFESGESGIISTESKLEWFDGIEWKPVENDFKYEESKHKEKITSDEFTKSESSPEESPDKTAKGENIAKLNVSKSENTNVKEIFVSQLRATKSEDLRLTMYRSPVNCEVCNKTFQSKWNLKRHMVSMHTRSASASPDFQKRNQDVLVEGFENIKVTEEDKAEHSNKIKNNTETLSKDTDDHETLKHEETNQSMKKRRLAG